MNNHDFRTICLEINVKMVNPICKITNAPIKVTGARTDMCHGTAGIIM